MSSCYINPITSRLKLKQSDYNIDADKGIIKISLNDKFKTINDTYKEAVNIKNKINEEFGKYGDMVTISDFPDGTNIHINPTRLYKNAINISQDLKNNKINEEDASIAIRSVKNSENSSSFFNLNSPDLKRAAQIRVLKNFMIQTLKTLTVTIKITDPVTGVITSETKPIEPKLIENYKSLKNKDGIDIGNVSGVASLLDRVAAYTERDGVTSTEEVLHFFLLTMVDSNGNLDQDLLDIMELKDTDGIPFFEKSRPYLDNFRKYIDEYSVTSGYTIDNLPMDVVQKVRLEILAKLLAQYMYDKRNISGLRNKLKQKFYNIINFFLSKFNKNISLWAKQLDEDLYPIEYRKILDIFDKKMWSREYINTYKANHNIIVTANAPSNVITNHEVLVSDLTKSLHILNNAKKRLTELINNSPVKGSDYKIYSSIYHFLGMATSSTSTVADLTQEQIDAYEKKLDDLIDMSPWDTTLVEKKKELQDLKTYFNKFKQASQSVNQLYSIDYRINNIKRFISLKKYEEGLNVFLFGAGNIRNRTYIDYDYNEHGAIYDLYKAFSKTMMFTGVDLEGNVITSPSLNLMSTVRYNDIAEIREIYNFISPMYNVAISNYIKNNNTFFKNDVIRNERAGEALELMKKYLDAIESFLNNQDTYYYARRNEEGDLLRHHGLDNKVDEFIDRSSSKTFLDISAARLSFGMYNRSQSTHLRNFTQKIKTLETRVETSVQRLTMQFLNNLNKLGYNKLSLKEKNQIPYQIDKNGKQTHYMNSKYDTDGYIKSQISFRESLPKILQQFAITNKFSVVLEKDYFKMVEQFNILYSLEKIDKKSLPQDLLELWQIRDYYGKLWKEWHKNNSEELTDVEIENYFNDLYLKVPYYVYIKIREQSIRQYVDFEGNVIEYLSGPLLRPKTLNPNWSKLSITQQNIANYWRESVIDQKLKNNPDKYSYEWLNRAPQITKEGLDKITGKGFLSTVKYKVKNIFSDQVDDELYNIGEDGKIIKYPPLRYNNKIDNPSALTNDFVRSFSLYMGNAENRRIIIPELLELQGMIDLVTTGEVSDEIQDGSHISTKTGQGSNLEKAMNHLINTVIYGNTIAKKTAINTFLTRSKQYLQNNGLGYNQPSILNAWLSAEVDKLVFSKVDDLYNSKERADGYKRVRKELPNIIKDVGNPIKNTLLGALSVRLGVGSKISESVALTNISRTSRVLKKGVEPFGGWNTTEVILDLPLIAIVNEGIKLIEGKWWTRQGYEREVINKASKNDKKVLRDKWNSASTIMDKLIINNGIIDESMIPRDTMELFQLRALDAINQVDQKMSRSDRGTIFTNPFYSLLATYMPWFFMQTDKWFHPLIFNKVTGQWEAGIYSKDSLIFYKDFAVSSLKDLIKSLRSRQLIFEEVSLLLYNDLENGQSVAYIRNAKRIAIHMAVITILSSLAYIAAGIALSDDDDDEYSYITQLVALLLQKMRTEQLTKVSFNEPFEIVGNPLAHLDNTFKMLEIIDIIGSYYVTDEENITIYNGNNIYQGMNKNTVNLIRLLPYTKGLFENYAGWYLNPKFGGYLDGHFSDVGRSFAHKRESLRKFVVDSEKPGGFSRNFLDSFGLPSKIIGHSTGKYFLEFIDNPYYDNLSKINLKLPDFEANKDHLPERIESERELKVKELKRIRKEMKALSN